MLQNFLDGKKKYSAFIITVLATIVPLFVREPEAQQTIIDMIPSLAVLIAGIIYIVTQGKIDREKEVVTASVAQTALSVAGGTANGKQAPPPQPQPQIQPVVEQSTPFDPKAFHEDVLSNVEATYTEKNPSTIFYKARDKGTVTKCSDIAQAVDYWDYLLSLAYDANDYLRQKTETPKGSCQPRDPSFYVMQRDLRHTLQCKDNLEALARSRIDWKKSLASPQQTLYLLGELAAELLGK